MPQGVGQEQEPLQPSGTTDPAMPAPAESTSTSFNYRGDEVLINLIGPVFQGFGNFSVAGRESTTVTCIRALSPGEGRQFRKTPVLEGPDLLNPAALHLLDGSKGLRGCRHDAAQILPAHQQPFWWKRSH